MTINYDAADPAITSGDDSCTHVSVNSATSDDTLDAVEATPDMTPQDAAAGPDHVNTSCTAARPEAQAGVPAVAKPSMRGILEPAERVPETKIELNMGNHGIKGMPIIPVTEGVPAPFGNGVRRRIRVERAQLGPEQVREGPRVGNADGANSNEASKFKVEFNLQGTYSVQQLKDLISIADAFAAEKETGQAVAPQPLTVLEEPSSVHDVDVPVNGGNAVKEHLVKVDCPGNGCGAHNPSRAQARFFIPQGYPIPPDASLRHDKAQFVGNPPPQRPVNPQPNAVPIVQIPYVPVTGFQAPNGWVLPQTPVVNTLPHGIHYHPVCVQSVAMEQVAVFYNGYLYQ
ncbi:hypothetical protein RUND412_004668 [Rhizina undulata]